jgi:hypothetical protein
LAAVVRRFGAVPPALAAVLFAAAVPLLAGLAKFSPLLADSLVDISGS